MRSRPVRSTALLRLTDPEKMQCMAHYAHPTPNPYPFFVGNTKGEDSYICLLLALLRVLSSCWVSWTDSSRLYDCLQGQLEEKHTTAAPAAARWVALQGVVKRRAERVASCGPLHE